MPRAPAVRAVLARLGQFLSLGAGVACALGTLAWALPGPWFLDLFGHFRIHYGVALIVACVLLGIGRRWRWLAAAAILLVVDLAPVAPIWLAPAGAPAGATLRVVHFNVLSSNHRHEEVVAWLADAGADVIFVQEVSPEWARALARIDGYQLARSIPRLDNFGIAALVRRGAPVTATGVIELADGLPALRVDATLDGREVALLSVHTLPPVSSEYAATRDQQLAAAGEWARARRAEGAAPVVIGDLNATPWSAPIRALLTDAELVDSERGHGVQASWPSHAGLASILAIPIDHCLHDRSLVTVIRMLGPELGSDHLPVVVELGRAPGP